jgi:hypothetical protein
VSQSYTVVFGRYSEKDTEHRDGSVVEIEFRTYLPQKSSEPVEVVLEVPVHLPVIYLYQEENPGVYAGRESDNPSTVHRR